MQKNDRGELIGSRTPEQLQRDLDFKTLAIEQIRNSGENWSMHSLAIVKRNALARVLYLNELYKEIMPVPGVICEFGVHWGASLSVLLNLRNLYEPYVVDRMIYGFDTFSGFSSVHEKDGAGPQIGDFSSMEKYEDTLEYILGYHESISAFPTQRKFELIKGDASETIDKWLEDNPGATIALAIFDMDVYEPTKNVLEKIKSRLTSRSVLVFDEFSHRGFPGEVQAVREVFDMKDVEFTRSAHQSYAAIMRFR